MIALLLLAHHLNSLELITSPDLKSLTVVSTENGEELFQENVTDCTSKTVLAHVEIGEGVSILGSNAFSGYSSLVSVLLPYGLTRIKNAAFMDCTKLESIILPEGLQILEDQVFRQCSQLKNITLSSTITEITGTLVFYSVPRLQKFLIPKKNKIFSTDEEGTVLIKDDNIAFKGTCGKKTIKIPDCCTSIESAFLNGNYGAVTGVDFGTAGNLRVINTGAFRQANLISIIFPEGLEYIYGNPLDQSNSVQLMSFPSTLKSYGDIFQNVPQRVEIAPGCSILNKDENGVIYNSDNTSMVLLPETLDVLVIPLTVKNVNLKQLSQMRSLLNITAVKNHAVFSSYKCVLYNSDETIMKAVPGGLKNISVSPKCTTVYACYSIVENVFFEGDKVTSIAQSGFQTVVTLKQIDLPDSLETIGYFSFHSSGVESVKFPKGLIKIVGYAFASTPIQKADLSACGSLTTIDDSVFRGCSNLDEVTFPSSLKSIGSDCFYFCSKLTQIVVPNKVSGIGSGCFHGCTSLKEIEIRTNLLTEINNLVFRYCNFSSILIPNSIQTIYQGAFEENKALKNVTFEADSNLNSIQISAFKNCNAIETIRLPKSVTTLSEGALSQMYGLQKIEVEDGSQHFSSVDGLLFDETSKTLVVFPSGIAKFTIRGNIERIAEKAFYECTLLEELKFENVEHLVSFGKYTFYGCTNLLSIRIPNSVEEMLPFCFASCSNLANVSFVDNSNLQSLSSGVFDHCELLQSIEFGIGSSLSSIDDEAFSGCSSLKSINFPSGLLRIGKGSFMGCSSLTRVHLNQTKVSTIGKECFKGCSSITDVTLPSSLSTLGADSFRGCTSIRSIIYCGVEQFLVSAFDGVKTNVDVPLEYNFDELGGLLVNRVLDNDCQFPSVAFTIGGSKSMTSLFAVASVISDDDSAGFTS